VHVQPVTHYSTHGNSSQGSYHQPVPFGPSAVGGTKPRGPGNRPAAAQWQACPRARAAGQAPPIPTERPKHIDGHPDVGCIQGRAVHAPGAHLLSTRLTWSPCSRTVTTVFTCPVCGYDKLRRRPYEVWPPPAGLVLSPPTKISWGLPPTTSVFVVASSSATMTTRVRRRRNPLRTMARSGSLTDSVGLTPRLNWIMTAEPCR
jgi:hypothetical protein